MTLTWLFFPEIAKIALRLGALPPDPVHNTFELHQFAQHATQITVFFQHGHVNLWFKSLKKSWFQL